MRKSMTEQQVTSLETASDKSESRLGADSANLDVLRAFAVSYVVISHTFAVSDYHQVGVIHLPWLGRLGVLFFFVHTCLVLMRSLERSSSTISGWQLWTHFYVRRVFRIYPLSILFVIGVVFFGLTHYRT